MHYILLGLYALSLGALAWRKFPYSVYLFCLLLPAYLIRFTVGPLPSTLLELSFGVIFLVWLLRYAKKDIPELMRFFKSHTFLCSSVLVFLCSSVAGIFVSDMWYYSLGQWRAYFLEPLLFFVMLIGRARELDIKNMLAALVAGTIPVSMVAILQKFFPVLYPPVLWDDETFGRVTSFFTTPNAIPLFILPPLFAGVSLIGRKAHGAREKYDRGLFYIYCVAVLLGLIALILSRSFGGILALGTGILVLIYFLYSKKLVIVGILATLVLAPFTLRLLPSLKITSMQNRFTLWHHSTTFLTESPKNFVFGAGIRQYFRKVEKPYYNPTELERLIYPHNIFLNFWTEIGLFGMLGFVGIFVSLVLSTYRLALNNKLLGAGLLAALIVFFAHGLIDVPYFKNDLAFLFWIMAGTLFVAKNSSTNV